MARFAQVAADSIQAAAQAVARQHADQIGARETAEAEAGHALLVVWHLPHLILYAHPEYTKADWQRQVRARLQLAESERWQALLIEHEERETIQAPPATASTGDTWKQVIQATKEGRVRAAIQHLTGLGVAQPTDCLLYTSPSPRDATLSRMPSSA